MTQSRTKFSPLTEKIVALLREEGVNFVVFQDSHAVSEIQTGRGVPVRVTVELPS